MKSKSSSNNGLELFVLVTGLDGLCPSFASPLRTPDYVRLRRGQGQVQLLQNKNIEKPEKVISLYLSMGHKKDIFSSFVYEFELSHKSRRSRVYHQDEGLHIIIAKGYTAYG